MTYGIPYDGPSTTVLGLNTRLLTDAGLDPSREVTWNWDWDQFLEYAQKVHEVEGENITRLGYRTQTASACLALGGGSIPTALPCYTADEWSAAAFDSPDRALPQDSSRKTCAIKHKFDPLPEGATFVNEQDRHGPQGSWSSRVHLRQQ